jgi:hypothetical protein
VLDSQLAPIGTTTGAPRFPLGYELVGTVGMLAPYGLRSIEDRAEFEVAYRARLERFGLDQIRRVLEAFACAASAEGVVLLCYEDLDDPDQWCHRTMLSVWWRKQTGEEVVEL